MTSPPLGSQQIFINTRTLRIGHQTYQLQNLARVQIVTVPKPADAGKGRKGLAWAAAIAVFFLVGVIIANAARSSGLAVLGIAAAIATGIIIYKSTKREYIQQYALILETTGNPITALVSPDWGELNRISGIIVDAIENPPRTEHVVQVNNVSLGDQYNQYGGTNVGRVGR